MNEIQSVEERIVNIDYGLVMVVTDLHGDWSLYARYRDTFLHLRERGLVRTLVLTGDLIHSEGAPELDRSLDIVLDLIRLEAELGADLVVLLGNHEMPHIYHVPLSRGEVVYTPRFEAALGDDREAALSFFRARPFFARTPAGVSLAHAGAFPASHDLAAMATLSTFSHAQVLAAAAAEMPEDRRPALRQAVTRVSGVAYDELVREYLAVSSPDDPRYDEYLLGVFAGHQAEYKLLWSALFSQNEYAESMDAYRRQVEALLTYLSEDDAPQKVLVTGHIGCRNGYRMIARHRQLRVASGAHAHPMTSARYLLFDAEKPVRSARGLLSGLSTIFTP